MPLQLGRYACNVYIGDTDYSLSDFHPPRDCIILTSSSRFEISVTDPGWDGTMYYSTDRKAWSVWDGSAISNSSIYYFRGVKNTRVGTASENHTLDRTWHITSSDSKVRCIGNIENLLDYETVMAGNHPTMKPFAFTYMFKDCTSLVSCPSLPAVDIPSRGYAGMFQGCTSLLEPPELPAMNLGSYCYMSMFQDCTSLLEPPELPAMNLPSGCYESMFRGCTSLLHAPKLSATNLEGIACYAYMFRLCESLTQLPKLPATALTGGCYEWMFYGASNIKISTTATDEYTQPYRIPYAGVGTLPASSSNPVEYMFVGTGGTFHSGSPEINTTYYVHKDIEIV